MTLDEALHQACNSVALAPPKGRTMGKWLRTDSLGKNGKGDGSVMLDEERVTAFNWQTGEKSTVWLKSERTPEDRRRFAERRAVDRKDEVRRTREAALFATAIVGAARMATHPYLAAKGFADEQTLTISADLLRQIAGPTPTDYLVPPSGRAAIVVPARTGAAIGSVQLIWEDGTKKFLFGGNMQGAFQRLASGTDTWLCEGYATALSLRLALRGLNRAATILMCFSAANVVRVASAVRGRRYIAADHDAPPKAKPEQFGGLGAGEYYARKAGAPYTMPPALGTDFNDMHQDAGIFAVQRHLASFVREAPT